MSPFTMAFLATLGVFTALALITVVSAVLTVLLASVTKTKEYRR